MKNIHSHLLLMYLILFAFAGYGQKEDTLFHFDAAKNNVSIGYDFRQVRKLRSPERFGPMHFKYERTITPNIGVGGASYIHVEKDYTDLYMLVFQTVNRSNTMKPLLDSP